MEMGIRADEISRVLKDQIKNFKKSIEVTETGTVLAVGDGVARVFGLQNVQAGHAPHSLKDGNPCAPRPKHSSNRSSSRWDC